MWLLFMLFGSVLLGKITSSTACYKTRSGECGEPLSKGECGDREWLVLGQSGLLECQERDCHPEKVLIDGLCLDIDYTSNCTGSGEAIFINAKGELSCQCKDGWGRNTRAQDDNPPVWGEQGVQRVPRTLASKGACFQEFTQGFCADNFLTKFLETGVVGCINNPCGNNNLTLPHFSTWVSSGNFTCHRIKLVPRALCEDCEEVAPEDVTNCEVVVDKVDNTVMCDDNFAYYALVNSCLGKKCCGNGKLWSRYRNRCVRNFKRFG